MAFDKQKQECVSKLYGPDRSKKGTVDVKIYKLLDIINKLSDFYTTSSCAGRITLFVEPKTGRKCDSSWLLVSHEPVAFKHIKAALKKLPEEKVWFRMESAILHVCCRDLASANRMMRIARLAGFKHSGVMDLGRRIMLELISTERVDAPISCDGKMLVSDDYLIFLIEASNGKLKRTREKIKKLESLLSKSPHQ